MKRDVSLLGFVLVGVVVLFGCSPEGPEKAVKITPDSKIEKSTSKCTKSCCPSETDTEVKQKPEEKAKSCCSDGKPGSSCCSGKAKEKKEPAKDASPSELNEQAKAGMPEMPKVPGGVKLKDFFSNLQLPEVVATIGDEKITKQDLYKEIEAQIPKMMRDYPLPPQACIQLASNMNLILDSMISRKLLVDLAAKDGIKPSSEMITARFDEFVKNLSPDKKKMFEAQLKAEGTSIEERRKETAADLNSQSALAIDKWVNEKIIPQIKVDDEAVEKYYRENQEQFKKPETIKVAHILITPGKGTPALAEKTDEEQKAFAENANQKAKKKAEDILAQLKQGGDFAKLAKENSACPSKQEGGILPEFDKHGMSPGSRGTMDSTFTASSYKLQPGGLSDVVQTPFGYHIIKCVDLNKESYLPIDKVKGYLKSTMQKEQLGKKVKTMVDAEKQSRKVVILLKDKAPISEK